MTLSDITLQDIRDYIKDDVVDDLYLQTIFSAAKSFVVGYTGLTETELEAYPDIPIVIYVLCAEMHDNRQYTVDKSNVNIVITSILNMHSRNLL